MFVSENLSVNAAGHLAVGGVDTVELAKEYDNMATVRKMKQIVPEYKSNNSVYEVLDKEA